MSNDQRLSIIKRVVWWCVYAAVGMGFAAWDHFAKETHIRANSVPTATVRTDSISDNGHDDQ